MCRACHAWCVPHTKERTPTLRAVGYARVSTEEQESSGLGLDAQRDTIERECERRGWPLKHLHHDVASGKSLRRRPAFGDALRTLADGRAEVLVVAKLDRLSRSVGDFAEVLALSRSGSWEIDVCDLGVDTTTPSGKMVAQVMMVLAEWEREMISDRTRSALAVARSRGTTLGRPRNVSDETVRLIRVLRDSGSSWAKVAETLTGEGVPTAQGGQWRASTVRKLYDRGAPPPDDAA